MGLQKTDSGHAPCASRLGFELRVMRGDFSGVRENYEAVDKTSSEFLGRSRIFLQGAIGSGDYPLFEQIVADIRAYGQGDESPQMNIRRQIALAFVGVLLRVNREIPAWLDLGLPENVPADSLGIVGYLAVRNFQRRYEMKMASVAAEFAAALLTLEQHEVAKDIAVRLKVVQGEIGRDLELKDLSERFFRKAVESLRQEGIILPFLDVAISSNSALARILREVDSRLFAEVQRKSKSYFRNVILFRNQWSGSSVPLTLSARDFYIARALSHGMAYKDIARHMDIAAGRMNYLVQRIYGQFNVHKRTEITIPW